MEMSEPVTKQYFNFDTPYRYGGGCYNDGFFGGGNGGMGFFATLLLFCLFGNGGFGGGWGGWGRNGMISPLAADLGVNTASDVAEIKAGINYIGQNAAAKDTLLGQIKDNQFNGFAGVQSALCQGFSGLNTNIQNGFYGLNTSVLTSKYDLAQSIDSCCCTTQRSIDAVQNAIDRSTCAIINSGKENTQAILTALCNHWQDAANRKICELEATVREERILAAIAKNA